MEYSESKPNTSLLPSLSAFRGTMLGSLLGGLFSVRIELNVITPALLPVDAACVTATHRTAWLPETRLGH